MRVAKDAGRFLLDRSSWRDRKRSALLQCEVYVESTWHGPRHIEFQILVTPRNVIHLGER